MYVSSAPETRRLRVARLFAVGLLAVMLIGLSGCGIAGLVRNGGELKPPTTPPGITGDIKLVQRAAGEGPFTILVEGGAQPQGAVSDKAVVTVEEGARVARGGAWIKAADLRAGMSVRVWFDGAVAESYPVQGTAAFVEVQ